MLSFFPTDLQRNYFRSILITCWEKVIALWRLLLLLHCHASCTLCVLTYMELQRFKLFFIVLMVRWFSPFKACRCNVSYNLNKWIFDRLILKHSLLTLNSGSCFHDSYYRWLPLMGQLFTFSFVWCRYPGKVSYLPLTLPLYAQPCFELLSVNTAFSMYSTWTW